MLGVLFAVCSWAGQRKEYRIFLITMDQMDQHWVTMDVGARKAVEELGNVIYQWMAPDVKDDAKQIEMITNAVAAGADAILLAANGPTAVVPGPAKPLLGVKIIYVDSSGLSGRTNPGHRQRSSRQDRW